MSEHRRWTFADGPKRRWVFGRGGSFSSEDARLLRKGQGKKNRMKNVGRIAGPNIDQVEAEHLLYHLNEAGLVAIHERQNYKGDWEAYEWIVTELGEQYIPDKDDVQAEINAFGLRIAGKNHPLLKTIVSWLDTSAHEKSPTLVRLIMAIGEEIYNDRIPTSRIISIRAFGHSKAVRIEDHRQDLEAVFGLPLEQVVNMLGRAVLAFGSFRFLVHNRQIEGDWSIPWLALTQETIEEMQDLEVMGHRLLTIENQTVFEETVRNGLRKDTVAVYTGGFSGYLEKTFLNKLVKAGITHVDHWGDLDLGGLRILRHLSEILPIPVMPYRMEPYLLETLTTLPLTDADKQGLKNWLTDDKAPCKDLAKTMLRLNRKVEQESWYLLEKWSDG